MVGKSKSISSRNIRIFYLTQIIDTLMFHVPIIVVYLQKRVSAPQVTFLIGFRYLVQLLTELPTGAFADMFGKRTSIIVGFFFNFLYFFLLATGTSFSQLLLAYTLGGIGDSFISGSIEALVYDSLKQDGREKEFSHVMAKQSLLSQISIVFATSVGGLLYQYAPLLPFVLLVLGQLSACSLSFFFFEPKIDTLKFTLSNYVRQIKYGTKELFKNRSISYISLYYIAVGGITWSCAMLLNSYMMVDLGFPNAMRGYLEGGLRLMNALILVRIFKNEKIFTYKVTFLFFPIIMVCSLLPGVFLNGYLALPFIAGSFMASSARFMILSKYTNAEFDSQYRATAISALSMFIGIIYVFIMFTSGPVIAHFGGMRMVYSLLGVCALFIVLPLALIIIRHNEDKVSKLTS
jgi:MFS family permease